MASDATASPPVTCVGRNEKSPRPSAGSTSATRSRLLHESAVRRPSGLSAGTSPSFVIRSTIASPGPAPRLSASTRLIATVSVAGSFVSGTNPNDSRSSQASSVARAVRTARSPAVPSSDTSVTIAGTIRVAAVLVVAACDRRRPWVSSASSARKNPSESTAAWMPPRRARASRRNPCASVSPTPSAPAMVAATMPQAAAKATMCGHHCRVSRRASPTRLFTGGDSARREGPSAVMARAARR